MTKVQKTVGEFPVDVVVLAEVISFDAEGYVEIESAEVLNVLAKIPGYVVYHEPSEPSEDSQDEENENTSEDDNEEDENTSEDGNEENAEPVKAPQRKRPGVSRPKKGE